MYNIVGDVMNYIKEIHKRFDFFNIFITSTFLCISSYLLDYFNIFSILINKYELLIKCSIIFIAVVTICEILKKRLLNIILIETINYFDKLLFIGIIAEIMFLYQLLNLYSIWKLIFFIFIFIINTILLFVRLSRIEKLIQESNKKTTNVYDIYDLYNNNIKDDKLIILEEDAITTKEKDLLNNDIFLDSIKESLVYCNPKKPFVIALNGKWGGGKTSIINMLKEKINGDNIALETFNPWKYDDKLSLFKGFYNFILKVFGKNYGYFNYRSFFKKYERMVFSTIEKTTNISLPYFLNDTDEKDVEIIKQRINDCILLNKKKLIVVIDDIDRLDKEQILFIFKIVKTIFNFNNIVYILCYDEQRVNKIFEEELKIDSDYIKKIVQNKIDIPKIENDTLVDIGTKCIVNLLKVYYIDYNNKEKLNKVLKKIFTNFDNLRDIIRYINSISISIKYLNILKLDICDYLILEYIRYIDINLYTTIYNNAEMFVSEDSNYALEYVYYLPSEFNKKAEDFYNDIFENKQNIKKLLAEVFPNVEKYNKGHKIREEHYYFPNYDRPNSIKKRRCYNGRFFMCYFTIKHSFFTELNLIVNNFIFNVNNKGNIKEEFEKMLSKINPQNYDLLFELLNIRINEINDKEDLFSNVLEKMSSYEDNLRFFSYSSYDRAKSILSTIIINDYSSGKKYLDAIYHKDLKLLEQVLHLIKPDISHIENTQELFDYGKSMLIEKLNAMIKNKEDIFNSNYQYDFCWVFYRCLDDKEKVKKYLSSLINEKNIFKIIRSCVTQSIGTELRHRFDTDNFDLLYDVKKFEKVFKKVDLTNVNKEQQKILELYTTKDEKQVIEPIKDEEL